MALGFDLLVAFLMVPFVFACEGSTNDCTSVTLQSSVLQLNWNFQNVPEIDLFKIYANCMNPSICTDGNCNHNKAPSESSYNIINITQSTSQTSCEASVTAFKRADGTQIGQPFTVRFRFDTYCAGHYYNVTSNMVYIAPNSAACFRCILPDQNIPDVWLVNGKEDAYNINAEGTLIVTNTSEVFGDPKTNPELECGNKENNSSLKASIAYTAPAQIVGFPGDDSVMATANTTAPHPYTIKCSVISGTQPISTLTLQRVLSNGTAVNLTTTTSTSITFTLQSPLPNDTGVYVCIATNSLGNDTRQLNLTVQAPAKIVGFPGDDVVMATANTTAKLPYTINCSVISGTQPIPTLTLQRVLSNGTAVNLTTTTSTSITFTLQSPLPNDTGVYVCIATNSLGNDTRQLNLTVQERLMDTITSTSSRVTAIIAPLVTTTPIVIIIICVVLLGIQRYFANIDKQEIASLERIIKDHTTMWKMLSISSITSHLDKLEAPAQVDTTIDETGDLAHHAGDSSTACLDYSTAAVPTSSEQVALGYIAIPDVRSANCSDPHAVPIDPPEDTAVIVTAEPSSLLKKGTSRQSGVPPVIRAGYCTIKTCDSYIRSGLQGAEMQGYIASSQVCGTILNTEANTFDCTDHSKQPCSLVSGYIDSKQVTHDQSYARKDPTMDTEWPLSYSCDQSVALVCTAIPEISSGVCSENKLADESACTTNCQSSAMSMDPSENTPDIMTDEPGYPLEGDTVWHSNADELIEPMSATLGKLTIKFGGSKTELFGADITPSRGTLGSNTSDYSPAQCNIGFGYIDSKHVVVRDDTCEACKTDSELPFSCEHKVAMGYIGISEIRSTICSENYLSEHTNCTTHMEAHHEKANFSVIVTEQANGMLKIGTPMCSDPEVPVTVDVEDTSLYSDGMTMLPVLYGADIQGYIASPNTYSAIESNEHDMLGYVV